MSVSWKIMESRTGTAIFLVHSFTEGRRNHRHTLMPPGVKVISVALKTYCTITQTIIRKVIMYNNEHTRPPHSYCRGRFLRIVPSNTITMTPAWSFPSTGSQLLIVILWIPFNLYSVRHEQTTDSCSTGWYGRPHLLMDIKKAGHT